MLVHLFQIILNFLYVCQSVIWLSFLLILHRYWHISSSGWDFFLKFFENIPGMFVHLFRILPISLYVCPSVIWLTSFLKSCKYRCISNSGWNIFLKLFVYIPRIFLNYFQIIPNFLYDYQCVYQLTVDDISF